jgi:hypothetical protein
MARMTPVDVKQKLYEKIERANAKGSGYLVGMGSNLRWFIALDKLRREKRVVIKNHELYVSTKKSK